MIKIKTNTTKIVTLMLTLVVSVAALGFAGCAKTESKSIVLLTDFGSADFRVAQIKGIIYSNFAQVNLVEASENVPVFDIATGAFMLNVAAREFPANTVFVGIVNPYSQATPRYIVATTDKAQIFVLPDNGLVTYVAEEMHLKSIYEVTNQALFDSPLAELSAERIEGKIGALLASGRKAQDMGTALVSPVMLEAKAAAITGGKLTGAIVYVDNYGNCITNVSGALSSEFGLQPGSTITFKAGDASIQAKIGNIYSDVPQGSAVAFVNSNLDMFQISINMGNFAKTYSIKAGENFEITK